MTEITIKNFQSIASAKFTVDGFTLIIGKNNIGKSALIRAINAALTNQSGDDFIREGHKTAEVRLVNDKLDVHWKKGTKTSYKVNGETFTALNRSVPAPILEAGFRDIEAGDTKINPLYAPQFEQKGNGPVFLLNRPGSQITDILSEVYDINVISKADELCQKEIRSVKSLLKTRVKDQEYLTGDLEKFKDFEKIKEDMEKVRQLEEKCASLRKETETLATMITDMEHLKKSVTQLRKASEAQIPDPSDAQTLMEEHKWLEQTALSLNVLSKRVKELKTVSQVDIPDESGHEEEIESIEYLRDAGTRLKTQATTVKSLKELSRHLDAVSDMIPKMDSIQDGIKDMTWVRDNHGSMTVMATTIKSLKKELDLTNDSLKQAEEEHATYQVCPACGGSLNGN